MVRPGLMKIGELAKATGLTTKTIRFYESLGLMQGPQRSESGYRLYRQEHTERLEFIKKAKRLGLSLQEIREIFAFHDQRQPLCIHVLALLDQKLSQLDAIVKELQEFRRELARLKEESRARLAQLPQDARICRIIERGIHVKGEMALAWLAGRRKV